MSEMTNHKLGLYSFLSCMYCLCLTLNLDFFHLASPNLVFAQESSNSGKAPKLFVEVASSKIRREPKPWSSAVAEVQYGDSLEEKSRNAQWVEVATADGHAGFIHVSAVTARTVLVKGSTTKELIDASSSSIVLAGKGFNKDVETNLRGSSAQAYNFMAVDSMEQVDTPAEEVYQFMVVGELHIR